LRQKLKEEETNHAYIKTHWGQGYWFVPLPQTPKPNPEPETVEPEEEKEERNLEKEPANLLKNKWIWATIGGFVGLFAFILYQQDISLKITSNRSVESTNIEASVAAEGFRDTDSTGISGQICVTDSGKSPTENLSIINTVQTFSESTARSFSRTVDLSKKPSIDPGETYCYPFDLIFEPDSEQDVHYLMKTSITITNHTGMAAGSKYCPGSRPCPFGPEITTDLFLPAP
jgi:hypothetical protein